jgi:WD40 repeat protein
LWCRPKNCFDGFLFVETKNDQKIDTIFLFWHAGQKMSASPSEDQVRAARVHSFLLNGPIPIQDINDIICTYIKYLEGVHVRTLHFDLGSIRALVTLNDGTLAYASRQKQTILCVDPTKSRCTQLVDTIGVGCVCTLAVLPDGTLACGSDVGKVTVWGDGGLKRTLNGDHANCVEALVVLPDGRLVSGSRDSTVYVWEDDEVSFTCLGHTHWVMSLAALPQGKLASGSLDLTVRVWDMSTRLCLLTLRGHTDNVVALAALPDGKLASGSWDKTVRVWDIVTVSCLFVLRGHTNMVTSLVVLPDGKLASGSYDKTVRVWNPATGECLLTLTDSGDMVTSLAVLPDGKLAAASTDGAVCLWE